MSKWQPIETAPEKTPILVFEPTHEHPIRVVTFEYRETWDWERISVSQDGNEVTQRKTNYRRWREYHGGAWVGHLSLLATHWMALPPPPVREE